MTRILVVDDEKSIRNTLKDILEYEGYSVEVAVDGHSALEMVKASAYSVILCDIKMEGMDGIEFLDKVRELGVETQIVMISGHGNIDIAVECIRKGAYDFIEKPLDLNRVLITIRNAMDHSSLVKEIKVIKKKVGRVEEIIGQTPEIEKVRTVIRKVAPTDARVLVTGANGTGKELVARWVHELSERSSGPFVEVNCAAIPSELIESVLFGHEKGSFTSALKQHKGKFEQANGGTLFLDEIGDMSLSAQAKVLRALQENRISRVGSDKDIDVDVRVVSATNKNLLEEMEKGNFREDLYHRLSVVIISVPALCDRADDIPLLVDLFLGKISEESGKPKKAIADETLELLKTMPWRGNIRELRNVVERLIILGGDPIAPEDVRAHCTGEL